MRRRARIDTPGALLDAALFRELSRDLHRLEAMIGNLASGGWVVLGDIRKMPALPEEAHRLMESRGWRFALWGSAENG